MTSIANEIIPMCLLWETFSNDAMKPAKMKDYLKRIHFYKNKHLEYLNMHKQKLKAQSYLNAFFISSVGAESEGRLRTLYSIFLNIAKDGV